MVAMTKAKSNNKQLEDALKPAEVRSIRTLLGLSRAELGDKLGMSQHSVRAWEMPADSPLHRKPNGAVCKLLRMWRANKLKKGRITE